MGVYGTVINFYLGWKNGVNLNPLSYGPKVTIALLLRWTFGLLNNYWTYRSVQLIPLSKSIIIFSLNPFCCAILGSIFLGEHVNKTTTFCIFGAWIGIYLLTINKQESEVQDGSLLGYFLVILSTWLSAGISKHLNNWIYSRRLEWEQISIFFLLKPIFIIPLEKENRLKQKENRNLLSF